MRVLSALLVAATLMVQAQEPKAPRTGDSLDYLTDATLEPSLVAAGKMLEGLALRYDLALAGKTPAASILPILRVNLAEAIKAFQDPVPAKGTLQPTLNVIEGLSTATDAIAVLRQKVTLPGDTAFGIILPMAQRSGWVLMAHRIKTPVGGWTMAEKVIELRPTKKFTPTTN